MSGNTLNDGLFEVTIHGRFNLDDRPITCPKCGADRGLVFSAFIYDQTARGRCPNNHAWDEPKLNGHIVCNIFRRNTAS